MAVVGPMERDEVLAAAPHLASSLLPAVRFAARKEPDAGIDLGQSKLGGAPDLARGTAWPCIDLPDGEHRYLQFYGQVDLGPATETAPAPLGLPTEGLLSFFSDHPAGRNAVILHTSPSEPLVRCGLRMEPVPTALLHPLPVWTWPAAETGPTAQLEARLRPNVPEGWHALARHQLGGHGAVPADPGWRLIFQIDTDGALDLDLGTLGWTARDDDVAASRWDAAAFIPQPA